MGFSRQDYCSGLPFPSPADYVLSAFFTMTHLSWVALLGISHSFTELCEFLWHNKAVIHAWTARRSNQSILKENNSIFIGRTIAEAEVPILFGLLMGRADSLEKPQMQEKIEDKRRREHQRMRWLDGITGSMDMNLSTLRDIAGGQQILVCCSPWGSQRVRHDLVTEQQQRLFRQTPKVYNFKTIVKPDLLTFKISACEKYCDTEKIKQRWEEILQNICDKEYYLYKECVKLNNRKINNTI